VMKVLKISSFSDQKERERCFEFSLPKKSSLERKERKFPVQITKNGKWHDYNALIVPKTFYRVVLTGSGINWRYAQLYRKPNRIRFFFNRILCTGNRIR
jgi:hypothetical protein